MGIFARKFSRGICGGDARTADSSYPNSAKVLSAMLIALAKAGDLKSGWNTIRALAVLTLGMESGGTEKVGNNEKSDDECVSDSGELRKLRSGY